MAAGSRSASARPNNRPDIAFEVGQIEIFVAVLVGGKAAQGCAASPSQMGRFETQWLAAPENLSAIANLSGQWIDLVHGHRPPRSIVLDMDSSVSVRSDDTAAMLSSRWPRSPSHGKCSGRFWGSWRSYGRSHHER